MSIPKFSIPFRIKGFKFLRRAVLDPRQFYVHLMDAYVDGEWEVQSPLTPLFEALFETAKRLNLVFLHHRWLNLFSGNQARASKHAQDIKYYYDLNMPLSEGKIDLAAFYPLWLGETMSYTMGYWPQGTKNLEEAQRKKLTLYQKLADIQPGQDVYEAGFGFGSFIPYVLERRARWHGANLSPHQCRWVRERYPHLQAREMDFLTPWKEKNRIKKFDRIVGIGALEHIEKLDECFDVFHRMLKPEGKLLVHLITLKGDVRAVADPWFSQRIAPHSLIHNHQSLVDASSPYFDIEHEQIFPGTHYQKTLHEWWSRFEANLDKIRTLGASERFIRLWRLYLNVCEAAFSKGLEQNSAFVFTPKKISPRGAR